MLWMQKPPSRTVWCCRGPYWEVTLVPKIRFPHLLLENPSCATSPDRTMHYKQSTYYWSSQFHSDIMDGMYVYRRYNNVAVVKPSVAKSTRFYNQIREVLISNLTSNRMQYWTWLDIQATFVFHIFFLAPNGRNLLLQEKRRRLLD